jgi:hypothetical protein
MFSSPRPILFSTELECPHVKELAIASKEAARFLYHKMLEPGGYSYENIDVQSQQPMLSTRRGEEGRSVCQVDRHTLRLEELHPEMPVDEFVAVVKSVLTALKDHWRVFFIQRCKVQCLSQPNVFPNPLGILASRIGNVSDKILPFGRPPAFFGVRFRFQPWSPNEEEDPETQEQEADVAENEPSVPSSSPSEQEAPAETDDPGEPATEARGFVTVRFEPYSADPSQVWIEVASSYIAEEPIVPADLSVVKRNLLETCRFATDNCKRFLDQFDPQNDPGGR